MSWVYPREWRWFASGHKGWFPVELEPQVPLHVSYTSLHFSWLSETRASPNWLTSTPNEESKQEMQIWGSFIGWGDFQVKVWVKKRKEVLGVGSESKLKIISFWPLQRFLLISSGQRIWAREETNGCLQNEYYFFNLWNITFKQITTFHCLILV